MSNTYAQKNGCGGLGPGPPGMVLGDDVGLLWSIEPHSCDSIHVSGIVSAAKARVIRRRINAGVRITVWCTSEFLFLWNGVPAWLYESFPVLIAPFGSDIDHGEVAETHFCHRGMSDTDSRAQDAADHRYVTWWAGQQRFWETWVVSVVEPTAEELNAGRSKAASRRPWVARPDQGMVPSNPV